MPSLHSHSIAPPLSPAVTPWVLRAWPPVLWQPSALAPVRFHHVGTQVTAAGDPFFPPAGQTVWAASGDTGEAGMAWDWVEIAQGVVAIADPMSVVTNLRIVGGAGEVLTAYEAALYLNELVRTLPWQNEVQRALQRRDH